MRKSYTQSKINKCYSDIFTIRDDKPLIQNLFLSFFYVIIFLPRLYWWKIRHYFAKPEHIKKKPINL